MQQSAYREYDNESWSGIDFDHGTMLFTSDSFCRLDVLGLADSMAFAIL
jgi:hypothetical protein